MENENYIMLNGKKIPLTPEQVKLIQADEPKKSPFDRAENGKDYYFVESDFYCLRSTENHYSSDDRLFRSGNYCTDENIMRQHALHMQLNHLLWRYSMTHGGDKMEFSLIYTNKYYIDYDTGKKEFYVGWTAGIKTVGAIYFESNKTAEAAIEEIVKPFVAEHPDFDVAKM